MSGWHYIATRLNGNGTETLLDPEVPLQKTQVKEVLSGAGGLSGLLTPELAGAKLDGRPVFEPWSTALYAVADGQIRGGGILIDMLEEGPELQLECMGFTGYASKMPYVDEWSKKNIDPLDAAREIWRHLQSKPGGNIGLKVDGTKSPVRIGNVVKESTSTSTSTNTSTSVNGNTGATTPRTNTNTSTNTTRTEEPYVLAWYKNNDLGKEFVDLAKETPFDYKVIHTLDGNTITHRLQLGYPEIKKRRDDLRFVVGENVFDVPQLSYDGDQYASEVIMLGAGEGRKMIRGTAPSTPKRLRRVVSLADSSLSTAARATAMAKTQLASRAGTVDISEIIQVDHPHAPLGSVAVGDDILVQTGDGWTDSLYLWCRVLAVTTEPERGLARLTLTRTEKASIV